jgi:SulP family sulfate permease
LNEQKKRLLTWKNEMLAGLTVSFAMVPEVVAFAFVTRVNPLVGLYAAFIAGLLTALFGGRPGMISGGAGSLAVVSVSLVVRYGPEYLFATVFLMGLVQLVIGALRGGKLIALVPHPVMLGFVNGLAIVILLAQLRHLQTPGRDGTLHWQFDMPFWIMLGLVALTIAITFLLPRVSKALPSALVAIGVVSVVTALFHIPTKHVGDLASIHGAFPHFHIPAVPLTMGTLAICLPYAVMLAAVGLAESLLTLTLVDQLTETRGDSDRECLGQGLGNVVTGLFGGMGGCAMIGQSVINIQSGGRRRLSGVVEALCILGFILFASGLIERVPMAALVGVMCVVVYQTFAWSSLRILNKIPRADAFVLVLVSVVTVFTNLAIAVLVGVLVAALKFAWENGGHLTARRYEEAPGHMVYELHGPLFFASTRRFDALFDTRDDPANVILDLRYSRLYDHSALEAVAQLAERYGKINKTLHLRHLSPACRTLVANAAPLLSSVRLSEEHRHITTERLAEEV